MTLSRNGSAVKQYLREDEALAILGFLRNILHGFKPSAKTAGNEANTFNRGAR